ncbi:MAG: glycosyl hydrolase [Cyclobacteriaceae bacterium]
MKNSFLIVIMMMLSYVTYSQSLTWTGNADNDFFNELNWVVTGTEENPSVGSIDPGVDIAFSLNISNASFDLSGQSISMTPSNLVLTMSASEVKIDALNSGKIILGNQSTLTLASSTPLGEEGILDISDNQSWVKLLSADGFVADSVYLDHIKSNDQSLTLGTDVSINQYYFNGSLIRLKDVDYQPLTLFDGQGQSGDSFGVTNFKVYSRSELGDFDNRTSSFRLARGYQVTMAIFQNGTGKSQVYVASEEALDIDLPQALDNNISFIRVTPWNWVTKKGASGFDKDLNHTWVYNWNNKSVSTLNKEYAPMSWGGGGATNAAILDYLQMENVTHVMGFNESDNCNDQSGQYGGLCQIEVAVPTFKNLMGSGLRLVSPSPRENGPFTWLKDFRDEAKATDVRYDVLGVHWYDWGANPVNTPFEDPQKVFNRFKNYLDKVYEEHGLPIWITEFNANANRDASVHREFMKLALPYLESLEFVERYDYFSVNPAVAGNRDDIEFGVMFNLEDGSITELGKIFRDHISTPALPEATWSSPTFLAGLDEKINIRIEIAQDSLKEGKAMFVNAYTDRAVGAPQTFSFEIENAGEDQFQFRDTEIMIPEGGISAETVLTLINDDLVEDTIEVKLIINALSDGIQFEDTEITLFFVNDDQPVVVVEPVLGTSSEYSFDIWPNPASEKLNIGNTSKDIASIQLLSLDGKSFDLRYNAQSQWDISKFTAGVYILKIKTIDGATQTQRIVIE